MNSSQQNSGKSTKQASTEQNEGDQTSAVSTDIPESYSATPKQPNTIQKAEPKAERNLKLYEKIIKKIVERGDVLTLGLYLGCDRDDIKYNWNLCHQDPRATAREIFHWFEDSYPDGKEKWSKLIEALRELGKNTTVVELGLPQLLEDARKEKQAAEDGPLLTEAQVAECKDSLIADHGQQK